MDDNKSSFWCVVLGIMILAFPAQGVQVQPVTAHYIPSQQTAGQSNDSTSGIWFNNAPGYKVNCVNNARYNGRSCVCAPGYHLNKIIETYDGAITSTVWQCSNSEDWYQYKE